MDEDASRDGRYQLVYEESLRSLSDQQGALDGLRSRAGTLLSAASISTSFLGGLALRGGHVGLWGWVAILSFFGVGLLIVFILLPTRWSFHVDADRLLSDYVEAETPFDLSDMQRNLALYRQHSFTANEGALVRLFLFFRLASGFLVLEVLAWLIDFQ